MYSRATSFACSFAYEWLHRGMGQKEMVTQTKRGVGREGTCSPNLHPENIKSGLVRRRLRFTSDFHLLHAQNIIISSFSHSPRTKVTDHGSTVSVPLAPGSSLPSNCSPARHPSIETADDLNMNFHTFYIISLKHTISMNP